MTLGEGALLPPIQLHQDELHTSGAPRWHQIVDPSWHTILDPVSDDISRMGDFLRTEVAHKRYFTPGASQIFAAFKQPSDQVKVVIVGQDPYPTPGHAIGLSFSVDATTKPLPKSLKNIFIEYSHDLGFPEPACGDLSPWSEQGVLLLNRVLTTEIGKPGKHHNLGWEKITEQAIQGLVNRQRGLVAILWGKQAQSLEPLLAQGGSKVKIISSPHPSPLSAHRGFFGSRPFSTTNSLLEELGIEKISWKLPPH